MSAVVRIAFAGSCLSTRRWWFEALRRCPGRFEAVCDSDAARASQTAERFGARWSFASPGEMLSETEPQVLVVGPWPDGGQVGLVRQALGRRVNVVTLGAAATTPGQAERLWRLAERAGRFVMVALPHRFAPAAELAQRLLASGNFGEPVAMEVALLQEEPAAAMDGGCQGLGFDLILAALDRACFFLGPAEWLAAAGTTGGVAATLKMRAGQSVSLLIQRVGSAEAAGCRLVLVGADSAVLEIRDDGQLRCTRGRRVLGEYRPRLAAGAEPCRELGYEGVLAEAIAAVQQRRRPACALQELRGSLAAAHAVLRSARSGRSVRLGAPKQGGRG